MSMKDFSFQGKIYLGENVNGKPRNLKWVGDQSSLNLAVEASFEERKENYSGDRATSVKLKQSSSVKPELTLRYMTPENIVLGVHGKINKVIAGTVTAEAFPADVVAGENILLAKGNVSNLVLTDSKPSTPTTLVVGQHYILSSAFSGMVEMKDVSSLTQPIKGAYSHGGMTSVSMLNAQPPIRYLYMEAINTVDGRRARVHLYKVQIDPLSSLPLTSENLADFSLNGSTLIDSVNQLDDTLGGYGKIEWLDDPVTP